MVFYFAFVLFAFCVFGFLSSRDAYKRTGEKRWKTNGTLFLVAGILALVYCALTATMAMLKV